MSRGTNSLIKQGAVLAESAGDVLKQLGRPRPPEGALPVPPAPMTDEESSVFRLLTGEPLHIDSLLSASRTAAGRLSGILTSLELKGLVRQLPGKYFIKAQ
jgi:DNA processing protein